MIRVIIVDEMEIARLQIGAVCRKLGFDQVTFATDAEEAWTLLQGPDQVDAVISSHITVGMTGEELLAQIKSEPRFNDLPFVFLISEAERPQIDRLLGLGVTGTITKPFTLESLEEHLRKILKPHILQIKP